MSHQRLEHAAVWTGPQLAERPEWNHVLTDAERAELLDLLGGLQEPGSTIPPGKRPWDAWSSKDVPLPDLAARLKRIQLELEDGAGVARVRGFPSEGLNPTEVRALYWAFSLHLGTAVSQSAAGEKIFSVRDAGFSAEDPRSRGPNTARKLSFHTDRGDVTGFLCLQSAKSGGDNEIASSMAVYNAVLERRPDLIPVLMNPFYYLRHTVDQGNDQPWCLQPVFSFTDGHFACCLLRVLIERAHGDPRLPDLTPDQIDALDLVEAVAEEGETHLQFRQEAGDLIFINNWTVLHRRASFVDHAEPELRRHILRTWLSMPNSRPLDPTFRENWGAVEPGAVRGGMRPAAKPSP
jgi:hypothetical protein